jgi:hypothetical protein
MEREHWLEITDPLQQVNRRWTESRNYQHSTALIVRVYLWAAAHDRPVVWACRKRNWDKACLPPMLPSQPTLSRRTHERRRIGNDFWRFMQAMGQRLAGKASSRLIQIRRMDGKPLTVAGHSKDPQATFGRGAAQKARGYKLHALWSDRPMPDAWRLTPLNVVEKSMAPRMLKDLDGAGYILADGHYDSSDLHDQAAQANHQLLAPRQHPGRGLGHHYQSPHRLHALQMLEVPANINGFGRELYRQRKQIERNFGNLCGYGGGLMSALPPWVRRPWRVRNWVHAKLLLNAARIRCLKRRHALVRE